MQTTTSLALLTTLLLATGAPLAGAQMNGMNMHSGTEGTTFDSGNMPPGATYSFTFNATGSFLYHCHLHTYMTAWVNVTNDSSMSMMSTPISVNITGYAFVPRSLDVHVGDTVKWTNRDPTAHWVMSGSPDAMMGGNGMHKAGGMHAGFDKVAGFLANMSARMSQLTPSQMSAGLARAQQAKLFSQFAYANGEATGKFVTFGWSDTTGTISDLRQVPWNETVFTSIAIGNYTANGTARATGAVFHAFGNEVTLLAHDNPTAELHIAEGDSTRTVTFQLSPVFKLNANLTTGRNIVVTDAKGVYHGHIVLIGNATATNTTGLGGIVTVTLPDSDSGVMFFAHPKVDTAGSTGLHGVIAAAAGGKLGAILNVADASGAALEDESAVDVDAHTTAITHGHVTIDAASGDHDGKLVVVNLPPDVIAQTNAARLTVTVANGTVTVSDITGKSASDAATVLNGIITAGHGATVNFAANGTQITVFVPHFSDQTLAFDAPDATTTSSPVTSSSPATNPSPTTSTSGSATPGFEGIFALAAVAGVGLLLSGARRKR
ncbi:MAG: hypothetical protein ACYDCK_11435 [Thermoplasmatota archaeon]